MNMLVDREIINKHSHSLTDGRGKRTSINGIKAVPKRVTPCLAIMDINRCDRDRGGVVSFGV